MPLNGRTPFDREQMLYQFYEWNHAALAPWRAVADATKAIYQNPLNPASRTEMGRAVAAMAELFERTTRVYGKPVFGLDETNVDGRRVPVVDREIWSRPFCRLLHFERALPGTRKSDPRILIVAPMSGHYATLLRGTVEALLPYAEVYITDWTDARLVPLSAGRFDLDDYVDHLIEILRFLGPDTHVVGVCQPAVPVLMATAVMEAKGDDCAPSSMTLMGGPIDTRRNPTAVNRLAEDRGIGWFRDHVIMKVPFPQPGFMRDVYPGFLQLTGFMSMNLDRHLISHKDFFWHLVQGDGDSAEKHRTFYDEYNAVMDLTAEFYLQTVEEVFIKHSLPKGEMHHRGERVDPSRIRRTALLTIEGEKDDISGLGQTEAAHDLCTSIPAQNRVHYVQKGVGHYGVFNGSRFRSEIAPRIVDFALTHGRAATEKRRTATTPAPDGKAVEQLVEKAPAAVSSDSVSAAFALTGSVPAARVESLPSAETQAPIASAAEASSSAPAVAEGRGADAPSIEAPTAETSAVEAPAAEAPAAVRPPVREAKPVASGSIAGATSAPKPATSAPKAKRAPRAKPVEAAPSAGPSVSDTGPEANASAVLPEADVEALLEAAPPEEAIVQLVAEAEGSGDGPASAVSTAAPADAVPVPAAAEATASTKPTPLSRQQRRKAKSLDRGRRR